jgi:Mrp family chromosome partitioning ATPase
MRKIDVSQTRASNPAQPKIENSIKTGIDMGLGEPCPTLNEGHSSANPKVSSVSLSTSTIRSLPISGQVTTVEPSERTRIAVASNGFRHLSLSRLNHEESRLVFQTDPDGFAAEQFRLLRRKVRDEFHDGAVVLITSPAMGDGKTVSAINLCAGLAETGDPTLLVETDIRRPAIRRMLGGTVEAPGLEDALEGKVEPSQAIYWIEELKFNAAMVTKIPARACQLITEVKPFLSWARTRFRWVVLDATPVLPAADTSELLSCADVALLVIRAQTTPRELSRRAIDMLGNRLRGVIFNEVTVDSNPHYRYLQDYTQASDARSDFPRLNPGSPER